MPVLQCSRLLCDSSGCSLSKEQYLWGVLTLQHLAHHGAIRPPLAVIALDPQHHILRSKWRYVTELADGFAVLRARQWVQDTHTLAAICAVLLAALL